MDAMDRNESLEELLEECPELAKEKMEVEKMVYRTHILREVIQLL